MRSRWTDASGGAGSGAPVPASRRATGRPRWRGRRCIAAALAAGAMAAGFAAPADTAAPDTPAVAAERLETQALRTGLYLIRGGGANSLLRLSAQGMVLVDAKRDDSYRPLMAQIRRINRTSDLPLRVVLLTHASDEHSGAVARFLAAGVAVVAPPDLVLPEGGAASAAAAGAAPVARRPGPVVRIEQLHEFSLGGVTARMRRFAVARGHDDSVVEFPDLRVVAIGELYEAGDGVPAIRPGGSREAWAEALDEIIRLEPELVVPSRGPPVPLAALVALRRRLLDGAVRAGAADAGG